MFNRNNLYNSKTRRMKDTGPYITVWFATRKIACLGFLPFRYSRLAAYLALRAATACSSSAGVTGLPTIMSTPVGLSPVMVIIAQNPRLTGDFLYQKSTSRSNTLVAGHALLISTLVLGPIQAPSGRP